MRVTHPFRPWAGRELEFVKRRNNWRADRVYVRTDAGEAGLAARGVDRCGAGGSVRGRCRRARSVSSRPRYPATTFTSPTEHAGKPEMSQPRETANVVVQGM
ncbi:MAG: DUF5372 family protein [Solirubrobacteraceae bacterium]